MLLSFDHVSSRLFEVELLLELSVEIRGLYIEVADVESSSCCHRKQHLNGFVLHDGGEGILVVATVFLREASCHQSRLVSVDVSLTVQFGFEDPLSRDCLLSF